MLERLDGTFPLAAFPRRLQEFIRTARDTLIFPEPFTASVMLLAVAVAIGNTRVLKVKEGWTVKPILFLALVGEAGANKSHPISFVLKPLDRINNEHIEAYNKALADYRKAGEIKPSTQITFDTTAMATLLAEYYFFTALQSLEAIEEQNPQRYPRNHADFIVALPPEFTTAEAVEKGRAADFSMKKKSITH